MNTAIEIMLIVVLSLFTIDLALTALLLGGKFLLSVRTTKRKAKSNRREGTVNGKGGTK